MTQRIITKYDPPPIPTWRQFAWSAITDNYDGGDPIGYGPTEEAAKADLLEQLEERTDG